MTHDPLCGYDWVDPSDCQCCREYAAVRADEREQAAQRITAQCAHTKYEGCAPCTHDQAAAAVRGEAS